MKLDVVYARVENLVYNFFCKNSTSLDSDDVSFHVDNLSGILVDPVLVPLLKHSGRKFLAYVFLKLASFSPYLLGQSEDVENVLV